MVAGSGSDARSVAKTTPFVIVTSGRSGSSWLMEMLNSHPAAGGYGELLSTRYKTEFPETRAALYGDPGGIPFFGAYLERARTVNPLTVPYWGTKYMNRLYARRENFQAIGFRARYGHLRVRWGALPTSVWLLPYMAARRVRVVHLLRRNGLDFLVSRAAAIASGLRHAREDEDVPQPRVSLDTVNLVHQLQAQEAHERLVRRAIALFRLPVLEIGYEELVADTSLGYRRVIEFLGAGSSTHEPQWRMRKVIDRPREEVIENYDGVRRALAGTKYASFLE